jgi:ELWxxDGT repeat protein
MATDGNRIYFSAHNNTLGMELWVSDGIAKGTKMLKDIYPGKPSANPQFLGRLGKNLYFAASNQDGRELWKTDGTPEGTQMVKDINPGVQSSYPIRGLVVDSVIYFTATQYSTGNELWKTDGTTEGTVMIDDINPGFRNSSPQYLTMLNDTMYFVADHVSYGRELWKYHPGLDAPVLVRDIIPGLQSSNPHLLSVVGNRLYFSALDYQAGIEVFYLEDPNYVPPKDDPKPEQNTEAFSLYPNPANNQVTLKWTNTNDSEYGITIYDILGQPVLKKSTKDSRVTLDISGYTAGTYIARIEGVGVVKFIKY